MPIRVLEKGEDGIFAIFDEVSTSGDRFDIEAACNAPAKTPEDHLDSLYFHSGLNLLEVEMEGETTVSHSAISSGSTSTGANGAFEWRNSFSEHTLVTHSLGYKPIVYVAYDDYILYEGMPVQVGSGGAARYVSVYVTTTQVILREWGSAGSSSLSAISIDYSYIVLRDPRDASGNVLKRYTASTGILELAFGRFSSDRKYLQIADGGSPFGLPLGRTMDASNGALRAYRTDSTYFEPVPSTLKLASGPMVTGSPVYGPSMAYNGSMSAPSFVLVQAP